MNNIIFFIYFRILSEIKFYLATDLFIKRSEFYFVLTFVFILWFVFIFKIWLMATPVIASDKWSARFFKSCELRIKVRKTFNQRLQPRTNLDRRQIELCWNTLRRIKSWRAYVYTLIDCSPIKLHRLGEIWVIAVISCYAMRLTYQVLWEPTKTLLQKKSQRLLNLN